MFKKIEKIEPGSGFFWNHKTWLVTKKVDYNGSRYCVSLEGDIEVFDKDGDVEAVELGFIIHGSL